MATAIPNKHNSKKLENLSLLDKPREIQSGPDSNIFYYGDNLNVCKFLLEKKKFKEKWIGFKTRLPKNFTHIDDRVLFFQFKNQHDPMKRSPLLGIRFYENGNVLDLGGDTGGSAGKSWSQEESDIHGIRAKYKKKELNWFVFQEKNRGEKKIKNNFKLTPNKSFKITKLGEWSTYKIGIYNTKDDDGFVKIFKDNKLIFNYEGITYDWKGRYTGSYIRIGIYRDSGKRIGIEYPDQSIHFDDFIVVSDKKTLDKYLN